MPNWVYNRVHGNNAAVRLLLNEKGFPTFSKIKPIPVELSILDNYKTDRYNKTSLLEALSDYIYKKDETRLKECYRVEKSSLSYEDYVAGLLKDFDMFHISTMNKFKKATGCKDWYSWNCKEWGCKWDANSCFTPDEGYKGDEESIEFETPWSPPEPVMQEIAYRYPDLEFVWHVDEESCAFSIDYVFNGDGTISEIEVFPEYFTPYIPYEDCELDTSLDLSSSKAFAESVQDLYRCDYPVNYSIDILNIKDSKCDIHLTVYDWDNNGGDLLVDRVFKEVKYDGTIDS